jgi:hypothetical protein
MAKLIMAYLNNEMKPIRIYISCNELPNTKASLFHIISKLKASSLASEKIIIVHSVDWIPYDFLTDLDIEYVNSGFTASHYEFPAIRKLWEDANKLDFYGLYLHCKGSSKTDTLEFENGLRWASLMMFGVVDNNAVCIQHLNSGADLVGSMWHWHFKGNFYWFNSAYVKQIVDPYLFDLDYRNNCEFWATYAYWWGRFELPKIKNLFYLPNVSKDSEFINIDTLPSLFQKTVSVEPFNNYILTNKYFAFDVISINNDEFTQFRNILKKFLNYDGIVINTDTRKIINYDSI